MKNTKKKIVEIYDISPYLADRLSSIAKEQERSRNDLILYVLTQYSVWGDEFFISQLPDIVRFMVKDTFAEQGEKFAQLTKIIAMAVADFTEEVSSLRDLLSEILGSEDIPGSA